MSIENVNRAYNNDIKSYFDNTSKWKILNFGTTCNILIKAGLPKLPLRMKKADFNKKVEKHKLDYNLLKDIPKLLKKPLLIFHSKIKDNYVVILNREINNELLMISIKPNSKHKSIEQYNNINKITSIHSRNANQLLNWTNKGLLIYADKKIKAFSILDFGFNCRQFEKTFNTIANIINKNGFAKYNGITGIETPQYYRARISLIKETLPMLNDKEKRLYSNGFIPKHHKKSFETQTKKLAKSKNNTALSFSEICSYSTWFEMHPEKVAGHEVEASSIMFPIKVKGKKQDIDKMFAGVFGQNISSESEAEALALALQIELELMELDGLGGFDVLSAKIKQKN